MLVFFTLLQQMAGLVVDAMKSYGTNLMMGKVPLRLEKIESGPVRVYYKNDSGVEEREEFDTVMFAIGQKTHSPVSIEIKNF